MPGVRFGNSTTNAIDSGAPLVDYDRNTVASQPLTPNLQIEKSINMGGRTMTPQAICQDCKVEKENAKTHARQKSVLFACTLLMLLVCVPLSAPAAARTKITFWTFLNPSDPSPRSVAQGIIVQDFMTKNPNIEVAIEPVQLFNLDSMLITATAAGGGPDVVKVFSAWFTQHVKAGSVAPLDDLAKDMTAQDKQDFLLPWDAMRFDGKLLAMFHEHRTRMLWYRKDLLDQAGLQVPKSWDEVGKAGGKLSTDRQIGFALGLSRKGQATFFMEWLIPTLWGAGGQLLADDGKAAFNSEAGVKVFQLVKDLVTSYKAMPQSVVGLGEEELTDGFKAGTVAMMPQGTHRVENVRAAKGIGPNLQTAYMPSFGGDKPSPAYTTGQMLAIGANSKQKEAAWKFIRHYLSFESQLLDAKTAGTLPVRKSVYADPWFKTKDAESLVHWKTYIEQYGRTMRYPEKFPVLQEWLAEAAQQIIVKGDPIKKTLDDVAARWNAELGR